jgi:ABC-2 type transport system ATP-binding protein
MSAAVEISGAGKRFGTRDALAGIDATIETGRLTGLVGPDGAGKTTLIRMMAALMTPTSGRIVVAGRDVATEPAAVHEVTGYMPQRFGLYEDLSVIENLRLYAQLRKLTDTGLHSTFERLLEFTQLGPFKSRLAGRLSGGMKQKLGLACALLARPQVLLLDEPSVGVDPVSRRELWRMVNELTGSGMAVLWSTAYLDEAEHCDGVLLLNAGRLEFAGPPADLTQRLAGRSFRIRDTEGDRRRVLAEALDLPDVCDGVIQGETVRAVLRKDGKREALDSLAREHRGRLEPVAPRFEDAFIDLLGGGPGGRSLIAERTPPIEPGATAAVSCNALTKRFVRRPPRGDLRLARAERGGQVDYVQDALRPAEADLGRGARNGPRSAARSEQSEAVARLHGAEVLPLRSAVRPSEPRILRGHLRARAAVAPRAHRRDGRDFRAHALSRRVARHAAARL